VRVGRIASALAAVLLVPAGAGAQSVEAAAGGFVIQRRVEYRSGFYQQSGTCASIAGAVRAGPLRAVWRACSGTLAASGAAPDADVRIQAEVTGLDVAASRLLVLGFRREVRRFESDAGVTVWHLRGGTVRLEPDFGLRGLRGLVDVSVLGTGRVRGGAAFATVLQTAMGASFDPPGGRFGVRLSYRFERYDLPESAAGPRRLEQFTGLAVEATVRLRGR